MEGKYKESISEAGRRNGRSVNDGDLLNESQFLLFRNNLVCGIVDNDC